MRGGWENCVLNGVLSLSTSNESVQKTKEPDCSWKTAVKGQVPSHSRENSQKVIERATPEWAQSNTGLPSTTFSKAALEKKTASRGGEQNTGLF